MTPTMRVLVTGGGGFIGSHLVDRLLRDGHHVRVLDNFATGRRENLLGVTGDVELLEGDIQSHEAVARAVDDRDVVFHQAALPSVPRSVADPLTTTSANVMGTLNVLLAARDAGVRRVVYGSSSSVYGREPTLPRHEDLRPAPIAPYPVSKLAGEGYCTAFSHVYGLETVSLRYFNVFGPRQDPLSQYAAVIPRFISAFREGRPPTIFGDGEQSRDFTYVENVVEANVLAAAGPAGSGERFNIACGESVTLNTVVGQLQRELDPSVEPRYERERVGDVPHSLADISRARETLGYRPLVRFPEGLRRTVEAFPSMRRQDRSS